MMGISAAMAIGQGIVQYRNAKAQAAALEYQARVSRGQAEAQARIAEQNEGRARNEAEALSRSGAVERQRMRDRIRAIQAQQAAAYGASGLSLASGTPLDVMVDTAVQGEEDVRQQELNVARRKFALINQAQDYKTNARLQRQAGHNQYEALMGQAGAMRSAGRGALAGSLFSVVGQMASEWGGGGTLKAAPASPIKASYATMEDELAGTTPVAVYQKNKVLRYGMYGGRGLSYRRR
ncbi:MAG: virion core protein, T7 gp14 family [Pyramidobacter sp.]